MVKKGVPQSSYFGKKRYRPMKRAKINPIGRYKIKKKNLILLLRLKEVGFFADLSMTR